MRRAATAVLGTLVWLSMGCVGIGGEKIPVLHDELTSTTGGAGGPVFLALEADDVREQKGRIGRATFTVFAITTGSVTTEDPVVREVSEAIAAALTHAGYGVEILDRGHPGAPSGGLVVAEISEFWFKNYNWFWPIVPTWGDITLGLQISDAAGRRVYERRFEGGGTSFCLLGHCAFKAAVRRAMNDVLDQVVDAVSREDFQRALATAAPN